MLNKTARAKDLDYSMAKMIYYLQFAFPLFFVVLIPQLWITQNGLVSVYTLSKTGYIIIGLLIITAYIDLIRRHVFLKKSSSLKISDLFSTICMISLILFIKEPPAGLPNIIFDDYSFGEVLVPWWSLVKYHMIPFWDYVPARGLINYLPGFVANTFFDGMPASFTAIVPYAFLFILLVILPVLRKTIGIWVASATLILMSYCNWLSEIDMMNTVYICILAAGLVKFRLIPWLYTWRILSFAILLFGPGQAGLCILSMMPLGLYQLIKAYQEDKIALIKHIGVMLVVIASLMLLTPLGKMVLGAVRYGLEQSSVNTIAYSNAWSQTFGTFDFNPWLSEIVRASWLIITIWAGLLILKTSVEKASETKKLILAYAIPIFILTLIFIFRAAGRIDPSVATRLGFASIWSIFLLLPILIFVVRKNKNLAGQAAVWILLAGMIVPYFGNLNFGRGYAFQPVNVLDPNVLSEGASYGVPQMGRAIVEPEMQKRLATLNKVFTQVLAPDETYLDLTYRHAQYYYFNRKLPIETGAVYNTPTKAQQYREIASLEKIKPPLILLNGDNYIGDGGPNSLRFPILYRYLTSLKNYKIAKIDNYIWMVRNDHVAKLRGLNVQEISDINDKPSNLIQETSRVDDLKSIPRAFGRSYQHLKSTIKETASINADTPITTHAIKPLGDDTYAVENHGAFIQWDVSKLNLTGNTAGIMMFDFDCQVAKDAPSVPLIAISWNTATNKDPKTTTLQLNGIGVRLLVPMDAATAWLVSKHILSIRFAVTDERVCSQYSVRNVRFFERL